MRDSKSLRECRHRNITESHNGRDDRIDDRLTHWRCLDCGDRFPLIGDTDCWKPKSLQGAYLLRSMLLDIYTPEGVEIWLADAEKKGQSLEEQLDRAEQLVTGAFI